MLNYITGKPPFPTPTPVPISPPLLPILTPHPSDSYPNVAASAIAAFLIPSFIMAAALCHLGVIMFDKMSTKWAMATIGFISLGLCALIYFIFFFGAKIRMRSKLARTF
jgi:hypothetical protein